MPHLDLGRVHAGLRGRLAWRVEDARGRVKQAGACRNLITDAGLNLLASDGLYSVMDWMRVGDDSTAPAQSDTALGNQIAATSDPPSDTEASVPSEGTLQIEQTYDFGVGGATGNLTEFGASTSSSGTLFSRALFRDGNGDPVTVSVASDEKLVLTYTIEITLSNTPSAQGTDTVDITGIGSGLGVSYAWVITTAAAHANLVNLLDRLMRGVTPMMYRWTYGNTMPSWGANEDVAADDVDVTADSYVSDSHERTFGDAVWGTSEANATHYGYLLSANVSSSSRFGLVSVFDAGDEFTKANTHELTITPPKVSWGRTP